MQKQKIFRNININLLTISPYAEIYGKGTKRILFYRRDINHRLLFESDSIECLIRLIECLEHGMHQDEILSILDKMGVPQGTKWIKLCIEKGMLE